MSRIESVEERKPFTQGSGNVFTDLDIPEPDVALAKANLADAIGETIARRKLTQTEAADIMNVDQPKVSLVVNGRLDGFSQDRLVRFLTALGGDVEIMMRLPANSDRVEKGRLSVTVS
ncbi:MAG: helix-turn-helix transcriptional regulator [Gemmatimonadota bacterium]